MTLIIISASSRIEQSFLGLPRLKIWPSAQPPLFSRMRISASMPSSMYVNERRCRPPSTRRIGSLRSRWPRNCVTTRLLPSFGASMSSRFGPIQLNGRKSVKRRCASRPYAQITRSSNCLAQE